MERSNFTEREQIIEVVNRLFVYTDQQRWEALQEEVFTGHVQFDMSSMGDESKELTSQEICEYWSKVFDGVDSVNHLAGNHLVTIVDNSAEVFVYATATHFKESASEGKIREYFGTYNLHLKHMTEGWRIDSFKYELKFSAGNSQLA
ncbi:nuclear transport factor 2 family protein [Persicitalea jodogahamensis]|uniref:SnoaL-like domain-containing protein n=1 Tax=Persicitalea jodogahamensis TaxID=402147 RepID=A0A8J3GBC3_9BACT|nr:nuclear transport factor 2 family protein [Persicitalea jodogahamensis]GHB80854.1 hypothetical protein GCM10007390_39320 [Persicitalea jodogahamensis]